MGGEGSGDGESSDDRSEGKYPGIASGPNGDEKSVRSLLLPRSGQTEGGGVGAWGFLSSLFRREEEPLYGVSFFGCGDAGMDVSSASMYL